MTQHLVGVTEIAALLRVSPERAGQIASSYADFPAPEVELAGGRVWSRAKIERWISAHPDRRPGRPRREVAGRRHARGRKT